MSVAVGLVAQTTATTNDKAHRSWEMEEKLTIRQFSGERKNGKKKTLEKLHSAVSFKSTSSLKNFITLNTRVRWSNLLPQSTKFIYYIYIININR